MELDDAVMVDRVLTTFGSSISDLRINFNLYPHDSVAIIDSILRNCCKLKSLTMESYDIPDCPVVFAKIRRLFGMLKSLHISDVVIAGWEERDGYKHIVTPKGNAINFFGDCSSLVHLKVVICFALEQSIFESNFPKLQLLHYADDTEVAVEGLPGFALRHENLKTLILDVEIHALSAIEIISANCTKLQRLQFRADQLPGDFETPPQLLGRLQYLNKLKIDCGYHSAVGLLSRFQQSTSLKELNLEHVRGSTNLLPTIAQIQSLRILKLCYIDKLQNVDALRDLLQLNKIFIHGAALPGFNFDLVDIIERLVHLKKFKFHGSVRVNSVHGVHREDYRISRNIYAQLVKVVQRRSVVGNAYLEVDCPSTDDFEDLICPTVQFNRLLQMK